MSPLRWGGKQGEERDWKRETEGKLAKQVCGILPICFAPGSWPFRSLSPTLFYKGFLNVHNQYISRALQFAVQSTYKRLERKELEVVFY